MVITWTDVLKVFASVTAIAGGIAVITKLLVWMNKQFTNKVCKIVDTKMGVVEELQIAQTRFLIVQAHDLYMGRGEISHHTFKAIMDMYEPYQKSGYNGYLTKVISDIRDKLDIIDEGGRII